ncbi:MAG TPA: Na(+)-translocating NADH-quinone reductase subunit A [Marinilabiliaceae bacterium]|nr:Na(+)-translocating NADH-quinone reductase subunit A [Marinilabiliaceae bacterium]
MSEVIKIRKGLNIPLAGKAEKVFGQTHLPSLFAIKPTDFHGLTPKMVVKVDDLVQIGSVLFHDKYRPEIKFVSPVSGIVKDIVRGERRVIQEVIIENNDKDEYVDFGALSLASLSREVVIQKMLETGAWPYLRQRPYNILANPEITPKSIFISGFDTSPLAADTEFALAGQEDAFKAGIEVLKHLAPELHLGLEPNSASKAYSDLVGVTTHHFSGPHPAGNVGIQIHHISPINKGDRVWTVQPQDVVAIGNVFLTGKHDFSRVVAVVGSEVKKPLYYRSRIGSSVCELLKNNLKDGSLRIISGNVLTGDQIPDDGYLGFFHNLVTVIPEGDEYEFLGWALPGIGKFSHSRTFFSWLCSKKKEYKLNANKHGSVRAIVVSGEYEKVLPMDILFEFLIKGVMNDDVDKMEQLGIYELVEEDIALCEYADTSKQELQSILRGGMELMIKEMG